MNPWKRPAYTEILKVFWTLFGPYASGPCAPQGTGPQRRINSLERCRPLQTTPNQLEVLAGAIPWGFKSPSPHQINQYLNAARTLSFTCYAAMRLVLLRSYGRARQKTELVRC